MGGWGQKEGRVKVGVQGPLYIYMAPSRNIFLANFPTPRRIKLRVLTHSRAHILTRESSRHHVHSDPLIAPLVLMSRLGHTIRRAPTGLRRSFQPCYPNRCHPGLIGPWIICNAVGKGASSALSASLHAHTLVLGKFGLVWSQAIFAGPETQRSHP